MIHTILLITIAASITTAIVLAITILLEKTREKSASCPLDPSSLRDEAIATLRWALEAAEFALPSCPDEDEYESDPFSAYRPKRQKFSLEIELLTSKTDALAKSWGQQEPHLDLEEATALLADIRETLEFHSGSIDGYNLACKTIRIDQPVATCTATSRRCLAAAKKYLTNLQPEN